MFELRTLRRVKIRVLQDRYVYEGGPLLLEEGQVYTGELVGYAHDDTARFYEIYHGEYTPSFDHDDPHIEVLGDQEQNNRALLRRLLGV